MKIERYDMIVIGAGPAGLSAAIEAAKKGLKPIVFDENAKPGGQLFKQIHKFFGSKEHKPRGIFCAIGRCTDCVMVVDGVPNVRTCITPLVAGMDVRTQYGVSDKPFDEQ